MLDLQAVDGGVDANAAAALPRLPAEQARYRVYDAVRLLLASVADVRPLVLAVDDLQLADGPSVKLLRHLLPFVAPMPLLIVVAFDDDDPSSTELELLRGAIPDRLPHEHLRLTGVSCGAVREILEGSGLGRTPRAFVHAMAEFTRGVPLHVLLLGQLVAADTGDGARGDNGRALGGLRLVATSARRSIAHFVATRLSAPDRDLGRVAAIVPGPVSPADLASLSGLVEADAQAALERLERQCVLARPDGEPNLYLFRHPVFRDVLLEGGDLQDRLSSVCAALSLACRMDKERTDGWQMAEWSHAVRCLPEAEDGLNHCLKAADDSDHLGAPELKLRYLAKACDVLDALGREDPHVLTERAIAAADVGAFDEASRSVWHALDALDRREDAREAALDLLVTTALALHDRGANPAVWRAFRDKALERLGERRDLPWARLALLEGGGMTQVSGPPLEVGRWTGLNREALQVVRTQGGEGDDCRTLFVYDWHSVDDVEVLLERARDWKSPLNIARALSVAAETLMYRHGQFDRACGLLEQQREMHARSGSIVEQAKSLVRLTMAQLAAGELEAALATRQGAQDMVARLGPGYLIHEHAGTTRGGDLYPEISMESNFAWYFDGDWSAVAEHWARAVRLKEPGGSPVHVVEAAMAAQAYARLGRFEDARYHLDELTVVLKRLEPRDWAVNGAVGRASHAIWDMAAEDYAHDYRDFALRLLSAGVGDWTNTSLELTVARMAALLDWHDEASAYFERARRKLGAKRRDPRSAIVDFDEAVALRRSPAPDKERREALLEGAASTFRERGMDGWVERAATELSQT